MGDVGCLVNMAARLVGCLEGTVPKVDVAGAVKKKGRLQVLDYK